MFEYLFKYPATAFSKGTLVFLGRWPLWILGLFVLVAAAALAWPFWQRRESLRVRPVLLWFLQTALVALLLLLLWQPALSIATLRPQQNVVAIIVDGSRSMALSDNGERRMENALADLNGPLIKDLQKRFQVRLYRAGASVERVERPEQITAQAPVTRLGEALRQVTSESATLPIGAVVLLSDGGESSGGIDLATMNDISRQHIPIHTVGYGREKLTRDIEVTSVELPDRVLANSRLSAQVSLRQFGYGGQKVRVSVLDGKKVLAAREVTLKADGTDQSEAVSFNAGSAGAKTLQISAEPLGGEENVANNSVNRLLEVAGGRPRILYIEGEPKWEFKFIRRAIEQDTGLQLTTILRTTQNKIYRQGVNTPDELEQGFPAKVDELFGYQGLIIGGMELNYFTPAQQELIRQFVDRRGGGLLFLGGRGGLSEGGWAKSPLADLLPVVLPDLKNTFHRDPANVELTSAGRDHVLCRLDENPARNAERWKKLPYLQNYQEPGTPKPGAVVLAEMVPTTGRARLPLLTLQNYGRGRTALFASAGSWRWQMSQPVEDTSHEVFWQQMLRWLVSGTRGPVSNVLPNSLFADDQRIPLRAEVRDKTYLPASDAHVEAHVMGPGGIADTVELHPDAAIPGLYTAEYGAVQAGSYVVETVAKRGTEEVGRDAISFLREDGISENFHVQQNKELLQKLASQTGGKYYNRKDIGSLPRDITYSEAGINVRETRDLWNMPVVFLIAALLRSSEWLLRRKWGVV